MKSAKKLAGILLALVMVFSLAAPVFATQEGSLGDGSITIEKPVEGAQYAIYQILYLESYNAGTGAYSYKANSAWATWLETQTDYVRIDTNGYVTWVKNADAAEFAKLAQVHAKTLTPDETQTATKADDGTLKVEFTELKLGYYLVDTTVGTICSLDTTNPNVTIEEKNGVPQSDKLVKEDSTNKWGEKNDADIGQTVEFKGVITAGVGAENYVYHDKMSDGLTYKEVTKVEITTKADDETTTTTDVDSKYYTVTSTGLTDNCTFDVVFTQAFCDTLKSGDVITIYYTAVLNENAVVGTPGNPNESHLSYGDSGKPSSTPTSKTVTYTWEFKVFKYTMKSEKETALADAVFSLYRDEACTDANIIKLVKVSDNVYRVAKDGEKGAVTEITTDETGEFTIQGLDSDTYYLKEITPPPGFNVLNDPIEVVITDNGKVNPTAENANGVDYVKVLNQTGSELPSTGGVGTTILYIVGGVLVIAAVVLLVTKKRMSNS